MRKWIGPLLFFAAGIGVGVSLMEPGVAQTRASQGMRLNHVGIYAKDYGESLRYYTQTLGFREAFTVKDKDGNPTLTYLQINRDTFLELAPANAQRPAGVSHIGIGPDDLNGTVQMLRERGLKVDDPRASSTGSSITNIADPNGVRIELVDFLAGSLPRKAIDGWK
jgi:catechol 2,3-dioxygenase-like lactoylglutathione lyase family enzyme